MLLHLWSLVFMDLSLRKLLIFLELSILYLSSILYLLKESMFFLDDDFDFLWDYICFFNISCSIFRIGWFFLDCLKFDFIDNL